MRPNAAPVTATTYETASEVSITMTVVRHEGNRGKYGLERRVPGWKIR